LSDDDVIAASEPSSASVGDSVPARNASTREHASPSQGSPVTLEQATERLLSALRSLRQNLTT
jgi:hypothetical protein